MNNNVTYFNVYDVAETTCQISNSYIETSCCSLPLLDNNKGSYVIKADVCPLCGGSLKPMGWFRQSGIKEMLCKCETCGLAVFRDVW